MAIATTSGYAGTIWQGTKESAGAYSAGGLRSQILISKRIVGLAQKKAGWISPSGLSYC
jgi:hypothetical protein